MPLQSSASSSNPLCLSEVRTELGISSTTRLCLGDSRVRSLAGKTSGTICLSDLLGKGSTAYTITGTAVYGQGTKLVWYAGPADNSFIHNSYASAHPQRMSRFNFSNDTSTLLSLKLCTLNFAICFESTGGTQGGCPAHTYSGANDVAIYDFHGARSVVNLGNKVLFGSYATSGYAGSGNYFDLINLSTETEQAAGVSISEYIWDRSGLSGITGYVAGGYKNPADKLSAAAIVGTIDKINLGTPGTSPTNSRISTTIHNNHAGAGFGNGSQSFVAGGNADLNAVTYLAPTGVGTIRGITHSNDTSISVSATITGTYEAIGLGTSTAGYICGGWIHNKGGARAVNRIEQFTYSTKTKSTLSNTTARALFGMGEISSKTSGYLFGGGSENGWNGGAAIITKTYPGYSTQVKCDFTGSSFLPPGNGGGIITDEFQKMNYSTKTVSFITAKISSLNQFRASGGQSVTATLGDTGW